MNNILNEIMSSKKKEIEFNKKKFPLEKLKKKLSEANNKRDFYKAVSNKNKINIIAEVKKASPSLGLIKPDFDHVNIAKEYEAGGAAAISVLTERGYFKGKIDYLNDIRKNVALPVLRKDFLFDAYQVYESKAFGADAVLLITALLDKDSLGELVGLSKSLGLDVLVEVHNEDELKIALGAAGVEILGINNRNLEDFTVDRSTAERLIPIIPKGKTVIVESGIKSFEDVKLYKKLGVNTFLIGESLMKADDIKAKLNELSGVN
ncbi:MAG: indole-3-glycerol phosphate synthase TrpC [Elusimicrobia bacterium]|nr:indole-3-glycerol phosphate synthase TrpC [Candidatus Liberimonas magnetica]